MFSVQVVQDVGPEGLFLPQGIEPAVQIDLVGGRDDGTAQQVLLLGQVAVCGARGGIQAEHLANGRLQLGAEGVVGPLRRTDLLLDGKKHLDVLHRQHVFDRHDVHEVSDLVPHILLAHRVGDKALFDVVADHRAGQLHPRKGAEMAVHILDGLVQIQPHGRQLVIPGQGKTRGRSRNTAFRFSIHDFSIQQNVEMSTENENKNLC